jgi:valyl-tRNA synthetase
METGYDILFFWVARMMMMGLHFMGDVPFRRVLLHGMVVDETGDKMSKVKGNTIDPLDLIHGAEFESVVQKSLPGAPVKEALNKFKKAYPSATQMGKGFPSYGTDALRLTLCSYSPQAKRIALSPKRIEGYRNFCNKLYNAVRFALSYIEGAQATEATPEAALLANRWVLTRLRRAVTASTEGLNEFRLDEGAGALYHFVWDELCDWHLEACKPVFNGGSSNEQQETKQVLAHCIETVLRALHPYAPFITEELWQRVPRPPSRPNSIALAPYPNASDGLDDTLAERQFEIVMGAIGAARVVRSEHEDKRHDEVPLRLRASQDTVKLLESQTRLITFLVKTKGNPVVEPIGSARPRGHVLTVAGDVEVLVGLLGLVDAEHEAGRIQRGLKKLDKDISGLEKRLKNPKFAEKAPADVVAEARNQLAALQRQRERLLEAEALVAELDKASDQPD